MVGWIGDVLETAHMKADALAEAFTIMGVHQLAAEETTVALNTAIALPGRPRKTGSSMYDNVQEEAWVERVATAQTRQQVILDLYDGAQIGFDANTTLHGTAWGMYNAITEAMDWRIPARNTAELAEVAVSGWRAGAKEKSFKYLHQVSLN